MSNVQLANFIFSCVRVSVRVSVRLRAVYTSSHSRVRRPRNGRRSREQGADRDPSFLPSFILLPFPVSHTMGPNPPNDPLTPLLALSRTQREWGRDVVMWSLDLF